MTQPLFLCGTETAKLKPAGLEEITALNKEGKSPPPLSHIDTGWDILRSFWPGYCKLFLGNFDSVGVTPWRVKTLKLYLEKLYNQLILSALSTGCGTSSSASPVCHSCSTSICHPPFMRSFRGKVELFTKLLIQDYREYY